MPSARLDQLQAMLQEEPGDKFLRYAIALEHKRDGNMEMAIAGLYKRPNEAYNCDQNEAYRS
ncbi:MAG TPA: hypothetical protein PKD45_14155, partial [Flavobacteriales bacterium]|nr:hypothetical protein [Flavobacteriales bacterium]